MEQDRAKVLTWFGTFLLVAAFLSQEACSQMVEDMGVPAMPVIPTMPVDVGYSYYQIPGVYQYDVYPGVYPYDVYPGVYPYDVYPGVYPYDVYPGVYPYDVSPGAYPYGAISSAYDYDPYTDYPGVYPALYDTYPAYSASADIWIEKKR